uniref:RPAP1 C-terminal domain-containing protein n=1 Tax=Chromera velia CCMP2878 TaxID=1169474 RepID=A0A0G4EZS7_9ALVE|eukprot:Cvel_14482.t1-p1 / transcript=Cvel_14482.t1 / gene=Cvel_14482 / organism=Chromera_velia_CCMP2878 / gene_product=hypothetical protein / transcript_product=hypothetical protein / location=Cvel_scaffold1032:17706-24612(-) / protein_length=1564 / sequence_SO=supercontig / SO=protein_coding / is_pseudo=false
METGRQVLEELKGVQERGPPSSSDWKADETAECSVIEDTIVERNPLSVPSGIMKGKEEATSGFPVPVKRSLWKQRLDKARGKGQGETPMQRPTPSPKKGKAVSSVQQEKEKETPPLLSPPPPPVRPPSHSIPAADREYVQLKESVDEENRRRLQAMTAGELSAAHAEVASLLENPRLRAVFQKRAAAAAAASGKKRQAPPDPSTSRDDRREKTGPSKPQQEKEEPAPSQPLTFTFQPSGTSPINPDTDSHPHPPEDPFLCHLTEGDFEKLEWTNPPGPTENFMFEEEGPASGASFRIRLENLRFDFEGNLCSKLPSPSLDADDADSDPRLALLRAYEEEANEDPLFYSRGLHHHGKDPALPGYTLPELIHLSQSSFVPQKIMAIRTLAQTLRQAANGGGLVRKAVDSVGVGSGQKGSWEERERERGEMRGALGFGWLRWQRYLVGPLALPWKVRILLDDPRPLVQLHALGLMAALFAPQRAKHLLPPVTHKGLLSMPSHLSDGLDVLRVVSGGEGASPFSQWREVMGWDLVHSACVDGGRDEEEEEEEEGGEEEGVRDSVFLKDDPVTALVVRTEVADRLSSLLETLPGRLAAVDEGGRARDSVLVVVASLVCRGRFAASLLGRHERLLRSIREAWIKFVEEGGGNLDQEARGRVCVLFLYLFRRWSESVGTILHDSAGRNFEESLSGSSFRDVCLSVLCGDWSEETVIEAFRLLRCWWEKGGGTQREALEDLEMISRRLERLSPHGVGAGGEKCLGEGSGLGEDGLVLGSEMCLVVESVLKRTASGEEEMKVVYREILPHVCRVLSTASALLDEQESRVEENGRDPDEMVSVEGVREAAGEMEERRRKVRLALLCSLPALRLALLLLNRKGAWEAAESESVKQMLWRALGREKGESTAFDRFIRSVQIIESSVVPLSGLTFGAALCSLSSESGWAPGSGGVEHDGVLVSDPVGADCCLCDDEKGPTVLSVLAGILCVCLVEEIRSLAQSSGTGETGQAFRGRLESWLYQVAAGVNIEKMKIERRGDEPSELFAFQGLSRHAPCVLADPLARALVSLSPVERGHFPLSEGTSGGIEGGGREDALRVASALAFAACVPTLSHDSVLLQRFCADSGGFVLPVSTLTERLRESSQGSAEALDVFRYSPLGSVSTLIARGDGSERGAAADLLGRLLVQQQSSPSSCRDTAFSQTVGTWEGDESSVLLALLLPPSRRFLAAVSGLIEQGEEGEEASGVSGEDRQVGRRELARVLKFAVPPCKDHGQRESGVQVRSDGGDREGKSEGEEKKFQLSDPSLVALTRSLSWGISEGEMVRAGGRLLSFFSDSGFGDPLLSSAVWALARGDLPLKLRRQTLEGQEGEPSPLIALLRTPAVLPVEDEDKGEASVPLVGCFHDYVSLYPPNRTLTRPGPPRFDLSGGGPGVSWLRASLRQLQWKEGGLQEGEGEVEGKERARDRDFVPGRKRNRWDEDGNSFWGPSDTGRIALAIKEALVCSPPMSLDGDHGASESAGGASNLESLRSLFTLEAADEAEGKRDEDAELGEEVGYRASLPFYTMTSVFKASVKETRC